MKKMWLPGDKLKNGTLYVGIINDGERCYHLSVEPENHPCEEVDWHTARAINGLPSIQEMNLISANAKALGLDKNNKWYWSSTEYISNYAWYERFSDGYQFYNYKNNTYFIRCVRRYSIIRSFDHLKSEISILKPKLKEIESKIDSSQLETTELNSDENG